MEGQRQVNRELLSFAQRTRSLWGAFISSVLAFGLAYFSSVSYGASDPRFSLLVSQALLQQRTIKLDAYVAAARLLQQGTPILEINTHYYYFFPLGTSVFSLPFVWAANLIGKDMSLLEHDLWTQNLISAALVGLIFLVIYFVCRSYLNGSWSLVITIVCVLGSSLISTVGTALWSLDFAVLFSSLSLLLIVRYESGKSRALHPYLLGVFLFAAFFCRPTTAVFIALALIYLLKKHRRSFVITAATSLFLLSLYLYATWLEYDRSIFSFYYSPRRFQVHTNPIGLALFGHFFSPSRGILIFSPFFVLVLAGALRYFSALRKQVLFWFGALWFGLHVLSVSRSTRWWGGHSFGPRILTDAIPALILLLVLIGHQLAQHSDLRLQRAAGTSFILLGLVGVFINSYQGLYNRNTARWNGGLPPDVDRHQEYLFSWTYPQFLATGRSLCARNLEYMLAGLECATASVKTYEPGDLITFETGLDALNTDCKEKVHPASTMMTPDPEAASRAKQPAEQGQERQSMLRDAYFGYIPLVSQGLTKPNGVFIGWSASEARFRWSECISTRILFRLGKLEPTVQTYQLEVTSGSMGEQKTTISINGVEVGTMSFSGTVEPRTLTFNGTLLKQHDLNEIEFYIPGAGFPKVGDARRLGLAFSKLMIINED